MSATEPCPFCDGTGERTVAPPPKPRGGQKASAGRTCGYVGTYKAGCRCDLCRAAWREARRRQRAKATA